MFIEQLRLGDMGPGDGDQIECPRAGGHRVTIYNEGSEYLWFCTVCMWGDYWPDGMITHKRKTRIRG